MFNPIIDIVIQQRQLLCGAGGVRVNSAQISASLRLPIGEVA
jgi:hypothetical protein